MAKKSKKRENPTFGKMVKKGHFFGHSSVTECPIFFLKSVLEPQKCALQNDIWLDMFSKKISSGTRWKFTSRSLIGHQLTKECRIDPKYFYMQLVYAKVYCVEISVENIIHSVFYATN